MEQGTEPGAELHGQLAPGDTTPGEATRAADLCLERMNELLAGVSMGCEADGVLAVAEEQLLEAGRKIKELHLLLPRIPQGVQGSYAAHIERGNKRHERYGKKLAKKMAKEAAGAGVPTVLAEAARTNRSHFWHHDRRVALATEAEGLGQGTVADQMFEEAMAMHNLWLPERRLARWRRKMLPCWRRGQSRDAAAAACLAVVFAILFVASTVAWIAMLLTR